MTTAMTIKPTYTGRVIESMGKTFKVYHEPNGWYAETDSGICLGPFDSEDELGEAVWLDRRALEDLEP